MRRDRPRPAAILSPKVGMGARRRSRRAAPACPRSFPRAAARSEKSAPPRSPSRACARPEPRNRGSHRRRHGRGATRFALKKRPCRTGRPVERDARLLLEFALQRCDAGLADFDAAAGKVPARNIAVPHEQDRTLCVDRRRARTPSVIGRVIRKLRCAMRDLNRVRSDAMPAESLSPRPRRGCVCVEAPLLRRRQWRRDAAWAPEPGGP